MYTISLNFCIFIDLRCNIHQLKIHNISLGQGRIITTLHHYTDTWVGWDRERTVESGKDNMTFHKIMSGALKVLPRIRVLKVNLKQCSR